MEKENNENLNSENEDVVIEDDDINALKEQLQKLEDTNKQLFERAKKAEGLIKEVKKEIKPEAKLGDIDYGLEAYLVANGIKEADERELFEKRVAGGQKPQEIFSNKYFQEELKDLRDAKAVKTALPSSSPRANPSSRDTVEYWKAKIASGSATLLDIEDVKLRREIVNSNINAVKNVNHFTSNPFGGLELPKRG